MDDQLKIKELESENLYLRAEIENVKKRLMREQEQAILFANQKLIFNLISPINSFERAINIGEEFNDFESQTKGFELAFRALIKILNSFNVEFIGSIGDHFDPSIHEAISQIATTPDKHNTLIEVEKGCKLNGKLIKPALVVVGKSK